MRVDVKSAHYIEQVCDTILTLFASIEGVLALALGRLADGAAGSVGLALGAELLSLSPIVPVIST